MRAFAEESRRANVFFAQRVQYHFHEALKLFSDLHVRAIGIAAPHIVEFMVADSPVVVLGGLGGIQGTAAHPCPLYEATSIWLPLAPQLGVSIAGPTHPDSSIDAADAQNLNCLSWRYAAARLVGSLHANLDRALGRPPGTITVIP